MPNEPRKEFDRFLDTPPEMEDHGPETPSGVHRVKQLANVAFSTKLQWGAIVAVVSAIISFGPKVWTTLTELNTAYAQDHVLTEANRRDLDAHLKQDAIDKQDQKKDMKALYDAVTKHKRSKRLERIDAGPDEDD